MAMKKIAREMLPIVAMLMLAAIVILFWAPACQHGLYPGVGQCKPLKMPRGDTQVVCF